MAFRDDIVVNFEESPRVATVAAPSVEVSVQDLHDTLTDIEDSIEGAQHDNLIVSAGKEDLGGGTLVGITSELQNIQVTFDDRSDALSTASITTPDATGKTVTDSLATFQTDLVSRGDLLVNITDGSRATILEVVSETVLNTQPLDGGTDNQYDSSDAIEIFKIYICTLSGGNTVAVDDVGAEMEPLLQSFGTWAKVSASSSATLQEQTDIQHASFDNGVHVDVTSSNTGDAYPSGNSQNPVNNWADAVIIGAREGFSQFFVERSTALDNAEDYTDATFVGKSIIDTVLTVPAGTLLDKAEFFNVSIEGDLGDVTIMQNCFLGETNPLNDVQGVIENCSIGPSKLTLGGVSTDVVRFVDCRGAGSNFSPPTINCGGNGPEVDIQGYIGQLNIENKTGPSVFEISINGKLTLDSTVTDGTIIVNGTGTLEDSSGAGAVVINNMIQGIQLQELWRVQGLERGNPMTVTQALRSTQDNSITLTLTGDGETTSTVTRTTDQTISLDVPLTTDLLDNSDTNATPTFTRSTTATYINPGTGLITSAAIDVPRFELEGLLIEEARTNIALNSEDINSWDSNGTPIITSNTDVAPDGTTTADTIEDNDSGNIEGKRQDITIADDGTRYVASVYIKKTTGTPAHFPIFNLRLSGGTTVDNYISLNTTTGELLDNPAAVVGTSVDSGDYWRVSVDALNNSSGNTNLRFSMYPAGADTLDTAIDSTILGSQVIWGMQIEAGDFPSSYIPTTSVAVARSSDSLTYNDDTVVENLAGSIVCDITPTYSPSAALVNVTNAEAGPLYLQDDTTTKVAIADGTNIGNYDPTLVLSTTMTVASRWSGSVMQTVANGAAGTEVSYDGSFTRTPGTLYIGSTATGNHINGNIKSLKIYNVDRGETQLLIDTA